MSDEAKPDEGQKDLSGPAETSVKRDDFEKITAKGKPAVPFVTTRDWVIFGIVSVLCAAADLGSKAWALGRLSRTVHSPPPLCTPPPGLSHYLPQRAATEPLVLIRNYLDFSYAENCGGAWGLLHGASESLRKPFFLLVSIGAVAFIVYLFRTLERGQTLMKWALPLVLGGAFGNLWDRVARGFVVDFIHAHWQGRYHWPTFNVADITISVGIGLMVLEYLVGPRKASAKEKVSAPTVSPAEPPAVT